MIHRLFKKTQKISTIENGKVNYYFKLTFLNGDTSVFDNSGNEINTIKLTNNNTEANNVVTYPSTKK